MTNILDQRAARLDMYCAEGDDFTATFSVTENGSPWVSTGATVTTGILNRAGTAQVTNFTTAVSTGSLTLTLTDTETSTLGAGVYRYYVQVTKSGVSRTWVAGGFTIAPDSGTGTSSTSAALSITTDTVTLSLTSLVAPDAANIAVADTGGYYTGTDVEAVLAELPTVQFPQAWRPPARGSVCFTFDDGFASWASVIAPSFHEGQKATFFVTTNNIGTGTGVSAATLTALVADGHELGAHSTAHQSYTSLTASQRATDHATVIGILEAYVGSGNVRSFAYPSGARNATTDQECALRYDRIFGISNTPHYRSSPYDLPGQFLYGRRYWAADNHDEVLDLIRLAYKMPINVVLYCHDPTNTSGSFPTDPSLAQVEEAFNLCDTLGVPMLTVSEALNAAPFGMTNGGFEDGLRGWIVTNSGGYTVEVVTDTPATGLPGTKSLHVVTTGTTTCFVEQIVPVLPGQAFSMQYRYKHISGNGHKNQVVQYDATGTIGTSSTSADLAAGAGAWTSANRDITALDSTTVAVGVRIYSSSVGAGEWYIDHVYAGHTAWGKHG